MLNRANDKFLACLAALLLLAIVVGTFAQVRSFEFLNFDDPEYVVNNQFVNSGLSYANIKRAFLETHGAHWHPLTWISHMADCELFGVTPGPHHLVNLAFHSMSVLLLFGLLLRILPFSGRSQLTCSFFIAAVFGVHPLRIESVAWVSERKDVLSVFFALLTLHAYSSYSKHRSRLSYCAAFILLTLGLLAKPMLVSLPILMLLLDYWPLGRTPLGGTGETKRWLTLLAEKLPFFALSFASCIAAILSQNAGGGLRSLSEASLNERFAGAFVGVLGYAGKLFWPASLGLFYPAQHYPPGVGAGAVLGLLAVTALCARQWKTQPYLLFGWLWFIVAILPVAGFIQIGGQSIADRWTYLPHIGLLIAIGAWTLDVAFTSSRAWRILPTAFTIVFACAYYTHEQLPHWRDSESIWSHTLEVSPDNFMAHTNLGTALDLANRLDEAEPHYVEAMRLNPTYPEALNNLGSLRARQNKFDEARTLFEKALAIRPDFPVAQQNMALLNSITRNSAGN